jgi:hypothetical protein
MIDTFSLALTHGLLLLAAWRLLQRPDLDREDGAPAKRGWGRKPGTD